MRLYLLTYEVVENYAEAAKRLRLLPRRVMLRIPIQWNERRRRMDDPGNYVDAFKALSEVADIMIEFVDSAAMKHLTPNSFEKHVRKCLRILGAYCKVAEAGNEVNGDWLGDRTAEKVRRSLVACGESGVPAAVTYYLSADDPRQMFDWIDKHPLSSQYALISHYPNTTPGAQVDFRAIFQKFAGKFSSETIVGWGEYGTQDAEGNNTASMSEREALIRKVEQSSWKLIVPAVINYAGLGGYWDWGTDMELDTVFRDVWADDSPVAVDELRAKDGGYASPDEDPGRPTADDLSGEPEQSLALARTLANYGEVEPGTTEPPTETTPEDAGDSFPVETRRDFQAPTMPLDIDGLRDFLNACREAGVSYGPKAGAKVPFHGATPGRNFKYVDCSGFVREAIWRATTPHLNIIDGSVRQHDWIRAQGFTRSNPDAALLQDGAIRICFLRPQDSSSGIGHVALVHNGRTIESHGGVGPDSRAWTKEGWQARTFVYILTAPTV